MDAEQRNAEILRLARLLAKVIGEEVGAADCSACRAQSERFSLPDLETHRRAVGRVRLQLEAAAENIEKAFAQTDLLGGDAAF